MSDSIIIHKKEYFADIPVSAAQHDEFQRAPFAQRVAAVIATRSDPDSIVIGINGQWGEGKTTVFNFIEESLIEHAHIVCFKFNPWRFPDETKLIRDFFQSLAAAVDQKLDKHHEKIGSFLGKYAGLAAAYVPGADTLQSVGNLLSSVEVEELKTRVESTLKKSGKRVVVLMDDIDRLDKNEIQTVFRLVKLVADFQHTAYVLAFDADMVASALQERFSNREMEAGRNFLEKIIQVPLHLPQISEASLREYCLKVIDQVIQNGNFELNENGIRHFVKGFDAGILPRLRTPRMAKRYANILAFAVPILKGEVNTVDLMLIEGIRVFYPRLYNIMRDNVDLFIPTGHLGQNQVGREQPTKQIIEQALAGLTEGEKLAATRLIKQLFPKLEGLFGGMSYGDDLQEQWTNQRLVTSRNYFQRYFSYAIPVGQISDNDFSAFVASVKSSDKEAIALAYRYLVGDRNAPYLLAKLGLVAETTDSDSAHKLIGVIVENGTIYPDLQNSFFVFSKYSQAASIVGRLVARVAQLDGVDQGINAAIQAVKQAQPLPFTIEIYRSIDFSDEDKPTLRELNRFTERVRRSLPEAARQIIGGSILERIKPNLLDDDLVGTLPGDEISKYLLFWEHIEASETVRTFTASLLVTHPELALALVQAVCSIRRSIPEGIPGRGDFERDEYNRLACIAAPDIIKQILVTIFGATEPSEHYPREVVGDASRELVEQFFWMHRHVVRENAEAADGESGPPTEVNNPES